MANELLAAVAILGVITGAVTSTLRGWWSAPPEQNYSIKKLLGSLLLAGLQAPIAIGVSTILGGLDQSVGYIATFFLEFSQGFTVDIAHTATKN